MLHVINRLVNGLQIQELCQNGAPEGVGGLRVGGATTRRLMGGRFKYHPLVGIDVRIPFMLNQKIRNHKIQETFILF